MLGLELWSYLIWPENPPTREAYIARVSYGRASRELAVAGVTQLTIDLRSLDLMMQSSGSGHESERDGLTAAYIAGECVLSIMGMYGETGEFSLGAIIRACSESLEDIPNNTGPDKINHSEKYIRDCLEQKRAVLHLCAFTRWASYQNADSNNSLLITDNVGCLAAAEAFRRALEKIESDRTGADRYSERNNKGKWPPTLASPREMYQPSEAITRHEWWPLHPSLANPLQSVSVPKMSDRMRELISKNRKTPLR